MPGPRRPATWSQVIGPRDAIGGVRQKLIEIAERHPVFGIEDEIEPAERRRSDADNGEGPAGEPDGSPAMSGSAPKRPCHRPWPRTTTGRFSSSVVKPRPRVMASCETSKKLAVTACPDAPGFHSADGGGNQFVVRRQAGPRPGVLPQIHRRAARRSCYSTGRGHRWCTGPSGFRAGPLADDSERNG